MRDFARSTWYCWPELTCRQEVIVHLLRRSVANWQVLSRLWISTGTGRFWRKQCWIWFWTGTIGTSPTLLSPRDRWLPTGWGTTAGWSRSAPATRCFSKSSHVLWRTCPRSRLGSGSTRGRWHECCSTVAVHRWPRVDLRTGINSCRVRPGTRPTRPRKCLQWWCPPRRRESQTVPECSNSANSIFASQIPHLGCPIWLRAR